MLKEVGMQRDVERAVQAAAERITGLPGREFGVEEDRGFVLVNHQLSMTWAAETRKALKEAVEKITGSRASVI